MQRKELVEENSALREILDEVADLIDEFELDPQGEMSTEELASENDDLVELLASAKAKIDEVLDDADEGDE